MSLQTSRYESQNIVNSFNLFIDSGKAAIVGDGQNTGDNYLVHLGSNAIQCSDGEIIRLSLVNFNMFNNIYNVNLNNCKFRVTTNRTSVGGNISATLAAIPRGNYNTIGQIAKAFADAVEPILVAASTATSTIQADNVILPAIDQPLNENSDRLIDITFKFDAVHGFPDGEVFIQCFRQVGDSFALFGAIGIDEPSPADGAIPVPTQNSFRITNPTTDTVRIQGFFPAQRMTDPNVYVRCSAAQNGLESVVLSDPTGSIGTNRYEEEILNSNILAKIHRNTEFINFETGSSDEYFVNLQQRKLSTLRVFLTDGRNRPLGRPFHADSLTRGTASGLEDDTTGEVRSHLQNQNGNLFFDAVIKVEMIKVRNPKLLESAPPGMAMPAREAQNVLIWQDYGRPKY